MAKARWVIIDGDRNLGIASSTNEAISIATKAGYTWARVTVANNEWRVTTKLAPAPFAWGDMNGEKVSP